MQPKATVNLALDSITNFTDHKFGYCPICESKIFFISTDKQTKRGSMYCIYCHSYSRQRHVAATVCKELGLKKLSEINKLPLKIYSANKVGALDRALKSNPNYIRSLYLGNSEFGIEITHGIYNQNLEQLSFPNELFDLVITEDVFEHVRKYEQAMKEIYRILKPNGLHIFTVPTNLNKATETYVKIEGDNDIYLISPKYHNDPLRKSGILVYRQFGNDTQQILLKYGFHTEGYISDKSDKKYGIYDSIVFVSRKF